MNLKMDIPTISPFHPGEREIQTRLGVREQIEDIGKRFIRDYMPEEHRAFYAQLPFLLIGSVDKAGRPGTGPGGAIRFRSAPRSQ